MLQGPVNSTSVAREALVSSSPKARSWSTVAPTPHLRPYLSGEGPNLALQASGSVAVGLAAVESLSHVLNQAVLETLNNARAPSTWVNY